MNYSQFAEQALTIRNEESANPNISPTGLPQPIYSYVKSALMRTLQLEYILARTFFLRGGSSSEKLSNKFVSLTKHGAKIQNFWQSDAKRRKNIKF